MKREWLLFISDTHGGSKKGLINPKTIFIEYDEKTGEPIEEKPLMTPVNEYLWGVYTKHLKQVFKLIGDDTYHLFDTGDATQGNKYPEGLLYDDVYNQIIVAKYNKAPILEHKNKPKSIRFIEGTGSHEHGSGTTPKLLRELFKEHKDVDIKTYAHGYITVNGVVVDIAHHGASAGIREWTRSNVFRLYTRSIVKDAINDRETPPRLVVRGHYHQPVEAPITEFIKAEPIRCTGLLIPSYQLFNGWTRKRTQSRYKVDNGMVLVETVDGRVKDIHWFIDAKEMRINEVIK